jgi:cell division septation protein DedD
MIQTAGIEQDLTAAQRQIAQLSAAVEASDSMIVQLRDELVVARQQVETPRQATPDEPNLESEIQQPELMLAATVPSARVVALQRELESAHQRIADLSAAAGSAEDEAAKLRDELSARQQEVAAPEPPTGPGTTVSFDPNLGAGQMDPDQMQNVEISSDPVTSEPDAATPAIDSVTSWVQLGAFKNPDNASTVWLNLRKTQSDQLRDLHHEIRRIEQDGRGTIHLLQVGPLTNAKDAKKLCHNLAERNIECLAIQRIP